MVTILASGKWAQKQPSYKGIWEKKWRQKQYNARQNGCSLWKPSKYSAEIFNKNPNPLRQKPLSKIHGTNWGGDPPSVREMRTKTSAS